MIRIVKKDNIVSITGHAMYDKYGHDIVCASVSSILYTTVNALLALDKESIKYVDNNKTIQIENIKKDYYTNTLIDNMMNLFRDLSIDYPKNIKIESEE